MEQNLEVKDQESLWTPAKLQDRFKEQKHRHSSTDICHEMMTSVKKSPQKEVENLRKEWMPRQMNKDDEIIKYMSKLPNYLERGKSPQEKVLNVGVLDWGRLEKWQHGHKQTPYKSRGLARYGNRSSSVSSDGSSPCFSKDQCSPSYRADNRPSLRSHFIASRAEGHSEVDKSVAESNLKFQDPKTLEGDIFRGKPTMTDKHTGKNAADARLEESERKDTVAETPLEARTLPSHPINEVPLTKVKTNTHSRMFICAEDMIPKADRKEVCPDIQKQKTVSVQLPGDLRRETKLCGSKNSIQKSEKASEKTLAERFAAACPEELNSGVPTTCQAPYEEHGRHFLVKQQASADAQGVKSLSRPQSAKADSSPTRGRFFGGKKSGAEPATHVADKHGNGVNLKANENDAEKGRSSSPFGRFWIGMGKRSKSFSSLQDQLGSADASARAAPEQAMAPTTLEASACDKSNNAGRSRSSPLRRLLDPLLKQRGSNCRNSVELSDKDGISRPVQSSTVISETSAIQSRKLKLDMSGCRKTNVHDSALEKKCESSAVQALLQVAVKNGLPLFTFAVDNVAEVLAATMKLASSGKDKNNRIYTFFTFREIKKKNGSWINQGGKSKGQGHDFVPNVVAQMKVSESQCTNSSKQNDHCLREFNLFSVDMRQGDDENSEFQPNNELAAIVVKLRRTVSQSSIRDVLQSEIGSKECLSDVKGYSRSEESVHPWTFAGREVIISTTVILPSGIHSLPSKGGPSSLVERWNAGGSCDCGGWDLGCKLRILGCEKKSTKNSKLSEPRLAAGQFKLFSQEGVEEEKPVFSLTPFKDRIYSVEFNSPLSLIQAFSICIAIIDCRDPSEPPSRTVGEKRSGETKIVENGRLVAPSRVEGDITAECISRPPLSPASRV